MVRQTSTILCQNHPEGSSVIRPVAFLNTLCLLVSRRVLLEAIVRIVGRKDEPYPLGESPGAGYASAWGVLGGVSDVVGVVSDYGSALLGGEYGSALFKSVAGDWSERLLLVCNDVIVLCASSTELHVTGFTLQYALRPTLLLQAERVLALHEATTKLKMSSSTRTIFGKNEKDRASESEKQLSLRWLHAPPCIRTVEGEMSSNQEGRDQDPLYGQGAYAWTDGSGEMLLQFGSKDDRDDALAELTKATDTARAR